jgi:undecaprenyl-diphosphatase
MSNWTLLVVFGLLWALLKDNKRGKFFVLALVLGITLSDQISSHLIKHAVERIRPCHVLSDINVLVNCGSGFSFPSSHAANSFAAVAIIISFYKKHKNQFFIMAGLIAFSRVVCGVHYPFDILCGSILGFGVGYAWAYFFRFLLSKTKYYEQVYMTDNIADKE